MAHVPEHAELISGAYAFKIPSRGGTIRIKDTGELIYAYGGIRGRDLDDIYGAGKYDIVSGGRDDPITAPTVPVQPGITPGISGFSTPITSGSLTSVSSPAYKEPETPAITTPKPEDFTPVEATPQEKGISDLIGEITKEQPALAGEKAAFQTEETKRLGLETLKQQEGDLFSQLKMQQAEFENLQLEDTRIKERLQQESIGRGRTVGGLAPLETAELRKNFLIKSEQAARVNVTAAILAGTQNKLLTAQTLIDRAVSNKYGAREADLKAKIDNLELLLKDPTLTVEQTNRANKQLAIQNKKKEDEAKKKADAAKILEWAVAARTNGATALEAQSIANIGLSESPELQKAFEIYSKFQKPETSTQVIGSAETGYLQFNSKTGKYDIPISAPGGGVTKKPLSILDINRYQELYPNAGVVAGDTEAQANAKVSASNTPEAKLKVQIEEFKATGKTFEETKKELQNSTTITDKALALKIAQQIYEIQEQPSQPVYGSGNFAKIDINTRARQLADFGSSATVIRNQLIKDGYSQKEALKASNSVSSFTGGIMNSISAYLFGE